jgi:hypothetical protein
VPRFPLVIAAGFLVALRADAGVDVRVHSSTKIDVRAERVALAEVLDALAEKTGMKLVYATERPQDVVVFDLKGVTLREAVTALLRDRGLGYAFTTRPEGKIVERLVITRGGEVRSGSAAPPPVASSDEVVPHPDYYEETIVEPPARRTTTPAPTPTPAP